MVVVVGPAVRLIVCWPKAAAAAKGRIASSSAAFFKIALNCFVSIVFSLLSTVASSAYMLSSITNSRESTSIIMSIPPGNTLFVVISRSLWECHIKAQPRSFAGLSWRLAGCNVVQLVPGVAVPVNALAVQAGIVARKFASGPKYGEPLYQGPLVKTLGSGRVAGPPAGTSPNGFTCTGLLWSWHHSMKLIAAVAPEL